MSAVRPSRAGVVLPALLLVPAAALAQAGASPYTNATRYDGLGRVTGRIAADPDGAETLHYAAVRHSYDGGGRLIRVETGELSAWQSEAIAPSNWSGFTIFRTLEITYDAGDRKVLETLREGAAGAIRTATQYSHTPDGQLECRAVRMNPAVFGSLPASACTQGTPGSDGPDRITRTMYDLAGQRLQLREGVGTADEGSEATWTHNLNGQITTVIDGNGNRAELHYDGYGRQDRWTFPSAARAPAFNDATPATALASAGSANPGDYEQYGYDHYGNRTSLRRREGLTFTFQYDALNRGSAKVVPERTSPWLDPMYTRDIFYSYDLRNLQVSARFDSQSGEGITHAYNGFGRLASSATNMGGVTRTLGYQYDRNGNRTVITHPDGNYFVTWYDGLNRAYYVQANGLAGLAFNAFTPHGPLALTGRPGSGMLLSYDGVQRPTTRALMFLNGAGAAAWTYSFNPAGQIASASRDADGYAWTGHYPVNRTYTTNGLNQYSAAGNATFAYDPNGNLISDGSRHYQYDVENRLVSSSAGVSLVYDPLGRLFQVWSATTGTTRFLHDGDALVGEYDGSNVMTRRHVHWPGANLPMTTYVGAGLDTLRQLYADHQGSIVAFANASGANIGVNTFDEYGIPGSANTGLFQFTGQAWLPELGMYYYKSRIYSPTLGRFMQTDTIGYQDQFNLYSYVANDPVNMTDPDGQIRHDAQGRIIFRREGAVRLQEHGSGLITMAQFGSIFTDRGDRVEASQNRGAERRMDTDCHGFTFANGEFWVDNNMVERILIGDNYREVSIPQANDVAIYRTRGRVVHSGRVASVNERGETMVTSKSGVEPRPLTLPGTPGPGGAWGDPGSDVRFYRQEPVPRPDSRRQH